MVVSQNGWFMRENAHLEMDEKNGGYPYDETETSTCCDMQRTYDREHMF